MNYSRILKENPYHDELGRFTHGPSGEGVIGLRRDPNEKYKEIQTVDFLLDQNKDWLSREDAARIATIRSAIDRRGVNTDASVKPLADGGYGFGYEVKKDAESRIRYLGQVGNTLDVMKEESPRLFEVLKNGTTSVSIHPAPHNGGQFNPVRNLIAGCEDPPNVERDRNTLDANKQWLETGYFNARAGVSWGESPLFQDIGIAFNEDRGWQHMVLVHETAHALDYNTKSQDGKHWGISREFDALLDRMSEAGKLGKYRSSYSIGEMNYTPSTWGAEKIGPYSTTRYPQGMADTQDVQPERFAMAVAAYTGSNYKKGYFPKEIEQFLAEKTGNFKRVRKEDETDCNQIARKFDESQPRDWMGRWTTQEGMTDYWKSQSKLPWTTDSIDKFLQMDYSSLRDKNPDHVEGDLEYAHADRIRFFKGIAEGQERMAKEAPLLWQATLDKGIKLRSDASALAQYHNGIVELDDRSYTGRETAGSRVFIEGKPSDTRSPSPAFHGEDGRAYAIMAHEFAHAMDDAGPQEDGRGRKWSVSEEFEEVLLKSVVKKHLAEPYHTQVMNWCHRKLGPYSNRYYEGEGGYLERWSVAVETFSGKDYPPGYFPPEVEDFISEKTGIKHSVKKADTRDLGW